MKKSKHNPPRDKSNFIKFSETQQGYLNEILRRQRREFNEAVQTVYEELGIMEKILNAPPGKYRLRPDRSGLDIVPAIEIKKNGLVLPEEPKK